MKVGFPYRTKLPIISPHDPRWKRHRLGFAPANKNRKPPKWCVAGNTHRAPDSWRTHMYGLLVPVAIAVTLLCLEGWLLVRGIYKRR